ncbi:MAG: PIN domain-containing protein [Campylobacterota bacterium]|nr:PIN domain-containing protein [Campylobacterota bacterium]
MFKVFLDANVIADTYDENRHTCLDSQKALSSLLNNPSIEIFTSCDIITTLYYILSKKGKAIALNIIIHVNEICTVIDFTNKEILESCTLMKNRPQYKDLEDTIQYIMAKKIGADLILSNDKGFESEDIKLLTTPDFNTIYPKGI